MGTVWVHLVGVVAMVGGMAVTAYLMRNRMPLSPRQVRRQNRWTAPFVTLTLVVVAGTAWRGGQYAVALLFGAMTLLSLVSTLVGFLRTPPPHEEQQNFAAEPGRCGRCEYDLTGNESGVCPECGWEIPRGELDVDTPGWMLWWRTWEIGHLRNWRRTLLFLVLMVFSFAVMGIIMAILLGPGAAVMPATMGATFGINLWRVVAYARRHRQGQ